MLAILRWRHLLPALDGFAACAMIIASVAVTCRVFSESSTASSTSTSERGPSRLPTAEDVQANQFAITLNGGVPHIGGHSALALVEFADFECPYCAKFAMETLPVLKRNFIDNGKVALFFMHFPLEQIHGSAIRASLVASCRDGQDGWRWENTI